MMEYVEFFEEHLCFTLILIFVLLIVLGMVRDVIMAGLGYPPERDDFDDEEDDI